MALPVTLTGTIQSYVASGSPFEKFVIEQNIPDDQKAECRQMWDALKKWQAANPDATMLVPSD